MNKDKWETIKFKFEQTLKSWEIDKKCNQFTVDSVCSLFPTELEAIINYIEELQQENQQLKDRINKAIENIEIVLDSYKKSPENALGLNINGLLDLLKGNKEE